MADMSSPDRPDEGHIADTGMFQRFVAEERDLEQRDAAGHAPRWVLPTVVVLVVIVVAIVIWLLVR